MKPIASIRPRSLGLIAIPLMVSLALATSSSSAATLFTDDFSGGIGDLHDTTPDTTTGGTKWVASSLYNADGSIEQGQGSVLPSRSPRWSE